MVVKEIAVVMEGSVNTHVSSEDLNILKVKAGFTLLDTGFL